MTTGLKIIGGAVILLAVSIGISIYFHWKFVEFMAMLAVLVMIATAALVAYARKPDNKMSVGWIFMGTFVAGFLMYVGWSMNFAPKQYTYQSCAQFYQIVQLPQPSEGGCTKEDMSSVLNARQYIVAGENFSPEMNKGLTSDFEETWRAEREGNIVSPAFPRFQQAWGRYQAALANEASDRLTLNPAQQKTSWAFLYGIILLGFLINGAASYFGLRIIGGVQFIIGLIIAGVAWLAWVNPNLFLPFFPANVSREVILLLENYWTVGFMIGLIPQLLPTISMLAGVARSAMKFKAMMVIVPAIILAFGMFINPNLLMVTMLPSINQAILDHPELSIQPIQLAVQFGLLSAIGGVSAFNGLIRLLTGR